jgi:hypothetical protein
MPGEWGGPAYPSDTITPLEEAPIRTADYLVRQNDVVVRCDGTFTVYLPPTQGFGKQYHIKNIGTGTLTIRSSVPGETIDGQAYIQTSYSVNRLLVDNTIGNWDVI